VIKLHKKWLSLLNKNIRVFTKHGVYFGIFCGVMNDRLYAKEVRIGWIKEPDLDCSKVSGGIRRSWLLGNVVKLEVRDDGGNGEYVKVDWDLF
jgi:hypothetical protein